ncbi:hypothetical protein J8J40_33950, partial [Mycobacterium tuberculosis]|nr:hypothetical protein [Mycobacterium tuberculosis]
PVFLRCGGKVSQLNTGDAVLLPRGSVHDLVSAPELDGRDIDAFDGAPLCRSVTAIRTSEDCHPADAVLFSGCMDFDLGT